MRSATCALLPQVPSVLVLLSVWRENPTTTLQPSFPMPKKKSEPIPVRAIATNDKGEATVVGSPAPTVPPPAVIEEAVDKWFPEKRGERQKIYRLAGALWQQCANDLRAVCTGSPGGDLAPITLEAGAVNSFFATVWRTWCDKRLV